MVSSDSTLLFSTQLCRKVPVTLDTGETGEANISRDKVSEQFVTKTSNLVSMVSAQIRNFTPVDVKF